MSQYPSPYSLPPNYAASYSYDPTGQFLAPAKRAGLLQIIVGALTCVYGLCNGLSGLFVPKEQIAAQSGMFHFEGATPISPETLSVVTVIFSAVILIVGIAFILLGVFVRRGGSTATVTSIVLSSVSAIVLILFAALMGLAALAAPFALVGVCIAAIPIGLLILQTIWLLQASKAIPQMRAWQAQYAMQYWQYQQQQQAYGQGYGAATPPANQPESTAPPDGPPV